MTGDVFIYSLADPRTLIVRYVGKTINLKHRRNMHRHGKSAGIHLCRWIAKLKREGVEPIMNVLEATTHEEWPGREIYWIDHFGIKNLVNMHLGGCQPPSPKGRVASIETRTKISQAKKGICVWSAERPHPGAGKPSPCRGQKRSTEFCERMRIAKLGDKNPMFGREKTAEERERYSEASPLKKSVVLLSPDGVILKVYRSIAVAAEDTDVQASAISRVCHGEYSHTHGYRFAYA